MDYNLLNVGFGSTIVAEEVIAILAPNSAPMRRLKDEAREENRLIDATHGRRTRSIVITKTNHILLSSIQSETLAQRFMTLKDKETAKALQQL